MFLSGLKAYPEEFPKEKDNSWTETRLSSIAALYEDDEKVYKTYDYRTRDSIKHKDRRQPNIELVRKFMDSHAEIFELGSDFSFVSTRCMKRDDGNKWFGPAPGAKIAKILEDLKALHDDGFVHGDIGLYNLVLHAGCLTDFDYSKREGQKYSSLLNLILW